MIVWQKFPEERLAYSLFWVILNRRETDVHCGTEMSVIGSFFDWLGGGGGGGGCCYCCVSWKDLCENVLLKARILVTRGGWGGEITLIRSAGKEWTNLSNLTSEQTD